MIDHLRPSPAAKTLTQPAASRQPANTIHQGTRHHDQKRINLHPVFNHTLLVFLLHFHQGHPAELFSLCVSRADVRRGRNHTGTGNAPQVQAPEQRIAKAGLDFRCSDHAEQYV